MAVDAVGITPALVQLSQVLAGRPLGQEPAPGFPGLLAGGRVLVTAVLERRAVVEEPGGERRLADPRNLMVDPEHIRWQGPALLPGSRRWRGRQTSERERQDMRDASDQRALEDQARQDGPAALVAVESAPASTTIESSPPGERVPDQVQRPDVEVATEPAAGDALACVPETPSLLQLRRLVAAYLETAGSGITADELRGRRRDRRTVALRRSIAFHLREQGLSLPAIGTAIGRDHTTVLYLLRTGGATTTSPGTAQGELAGDHLEQSSSGCACGGSPRCGEVEGELGAMLQALVDQVVAVAGHVTGLQAELERSRAIRRQVRRLGRRAIAAGGGAR